MKIKLEVTLDDKDVPLYVLRSASLLVALAQALRDEAYARGSVVSSVGGSVTIGSESIQITHIQQPEH